MNFDFWKNGLFALHRMRRKTPAFGIAGAQFVLPALIALSCFGIPVSAQTCNPGTKNPSVTVCTPKQNDIVATPTHVQASTTDSNPVTKLQIYVDNALVYQVSAATLDTYIRLSLGNHLLTVQAWDSTGATFKTNINVSMTPPCKLSATNQTITICTPGTSATVSLPVHFVAGTTDSSPVQSLQILENGNVLYQANTQTLDVYLTGLAAGSHTLTITATDLNGATFSATRTLKVTSNAGINNLKHIIFFVQENRSFDNYFGRLGQYRVSKGFSNNIDGVPLNATLYDTQGKPVHPFHFQTVCHENLSPFWNETHADIDGGKMDNFLKQALSVSSTIDPTGTRAAGYYDETDLPYSPAIVSSRPSRPTPSAIACIFLPAPRLAISVPILHLPEAGRSPPYSTSSTQPASPGVTTITTAVSTCPSGPPISATLGSCLTFRPGTTISLTKRISPL
ncbi:MAG: hypothetical protein DMG73_14355 [Acidobacteria bacterium]|nr:MAG: hypothetical protein DMG73_14355 [Acidobacteriota bacterium]